MWNMGEDIKIPQVVPSVNKIPVKGKSEDNENKKKEPHEKKKEKPEQKDTVNVSEQASQKSLAEKNQSEVVQTNNYKPPKRGSIISVKA